MIGIPSPEQTADAIQIAGDHYKKMPIQPWTAMEAWLTHEEFVGYLKGNALKYLARAHGKNAAKENHEKALHYLTKLKEVEDNKLATSIPKQT
jgi:hypothetical protein